MKDGWERAVKAYPNGADQIELFLLYLILDETL